MTRTKITPNFLNLPPELTGASSRYAVLPIPYERTVSYKTGTVRGPEAIIDASAQVERFDEELLQDFCFAGIVTLPAVHAVRTPAKQIQRVRKAAAKPLSEGKFLLSLGGEHSVSVGLVQAAIDQFGPLSVLQIDAHADLRDTYDGGPLSHACVMRRVLELTDSICQVGIRNFSQEEYLSCPRQVERFITPGLIERDSRWISRVLKMLGPRVYVTIDIDGFDPAFAPGAGTPEPGGLTWGQVTALLRRVCTERNVVAADIVEVRPIPPNHITEFLAARLGYKLIAYTQLPRRIPKHL